MDFEQKWTEQKGYSTKTNKPKNQPVVLCEGIPLMPDPAAGLQQNQGDPEPLGSPGSACLLLCLSCTQHRAVSTKRAVRGWRELPPPEVQPPSGPHLGLHSRHLSRQIVRCMKHRPRLWQELVLNGRLS